MRKVNHDIPRAPDPRLGIRSRRARKLGTRNQRLRQDRGGQTCLLRQAGKFLHKDAGPGESQRSEVQRPWTGLRVRTQRQERGLLLQVSRAERVGEWHWFAAL